MLSPRLTNCPECSNIPDLLKKINCKLAELGNSLYNNISYMLNQPIPAGDILQLIAYRRILTHKYCNPNYVHEYSVAMIASRVIRITAGCVSRCNEPERCLEDPCDIDVVANPTTTSTTTAMVGCKSFILYNTATVAESFLIGNCNTGEPQTIVLQGLSSTCINTSVALNVSPNIVVIDTDECTTTTTTSSSSTSTSTTSTTTASPTTTTTTTIACNCVTFTSTSRSLVDIAISYINCSDENIEDFISAEDVLQFCGCCGTANSELVIITEGLPCISGVCQTTSTTTSSTSTSTSTTATPTTTTTTTINSCPDCISGDPILIGTQKWTNCNLDVTTYRDGTPIPQVTDPTAWAALTTGAWCYYNNNSANGTIYGKLYNWYAVNNTANGGLAPVGYHVPTDTEWTVLTTFLGGETVAGGKMKETGLCHWLTPNTDATNESLFTALPGGYRASSGTFNDIGNFGFWWSSSEFDTANAWYRILNYNFGNAARNGGNKPNGFSVRLIENDIT